MRYYLADRPDGMTTTEWLATRNPRFMKLSKKVKPKRKYPFYFFTDGLKFDAELMKAQIDALFSSRSCRDVVFGFEYQRGAPVTVNHEWLKLSRELNLSRQDTLRFYNDQFSYRDLAKFWEGTELGSVVKQIKAPMLRSFVSNITADKKRPWYKTSIHRDHMLTCETRLVICLNKHPEFEMQCLNRKLMPESFSLDQFGKTYVFDSSTLHRAYFTKETNNVRTCVILSLSPWLNYNEQEQYWEENEFFGELHPLDIVYEGHCFK